MPSTIWTGSISFGLVNIPVSLVTAEQRDDLDFTLLDKRDSSPIGYQKISKRTGKPVPADRIVRGVEQANGRYVVVSDADLRRASPERTQRIDILAFVDAPEIPPLYFDRPYYLEPARGGERGYALFREALRRSGKVAVAIGGGEDAPASRGGGRARPGPGARPLRYAAELRDPSRLRVPGAALKALRVSDRELKMAERLVAEMTEAWDPTQYHDEYRDELLAFIKKRSRAGKLTAAPEAEDEPATPKRADVIDIAELLKRSLAQDRRATGGPAPATQVRLSVSLAVYRRKRDFAGTPEPGAGAPGRDAPVVRGPAPRREPPALRFPARARRRAEELGGAEGAGAGGGPEAPRGARRGSSARVRQLRTARSRKGTTAPARSPSGTAAGGSRSAIRARAIARARSSSSCTGGKLRGGWALVRMRARGDDARDRNGKRTGC